jgi:hypothetical protein
MASRRLRGRAPEEFSLSFLDVICCGFGAIILLLMITKTAEPQIIEASTINLEGTLVELQQQVFQIRGETKILNRDLNAKQEQLSEYEQRIAILRGQMASVKSRYDALQVQSSSNAAIEGELALAQQALSKEMKRLLGNGYQSKNQLIGGISADKEHVIFIVDTSPSMKNQKRFVEEQIRSVLNIYPRMEGFQIWNADGDNLSGSDKSEWLEDSDKDRNSALKKIWDKDSSSSPQKALLKAFEEYGDKELKIAIYLFGDDFDGGKVNGLVKEIDTANKRDANGQRMISINGVGIPNTSYVNNPEGFAHLMRRLSYKNGGSFVGLK